MTLDIVLFNTIFAVALWWVFFGNKKERAEETYQARERHVGVTRDEADTETIPPQSAGFDEKPAHGYVRLPQRRVVIYVALAGLFAGVGLAVMNALF